MTTVTLRPTSSRLAEPVDTPEQYYQAGPGQQLVADATRRRRTDFLSDGVRLAGHLYRPRRATDGEQTPAIVMCGPSSSVKEQTLPHYAERFADAGYTVLTFDSRTFGESGGEPRCYYDPAQIIADYSNAVSYLLTRDDVDPDRIALVGVCMGGGNAISTAARDKRVAAVVSVAGARRNKPKTAAAGPADTSRDRRGRPSTHQPPPSPGSTQLTVLRMRLAAGRDRRLSMRIGLTVPHGGLRPPSRSSAGAPWRQARRR